MATIIGFTATELLRIYVEDFYGKEGMNQEAHLYSYSNIGAKMIIYVLKSLNIKYEVTSEHEPKMIHIIRVDYEELLNKTGIKFKVTIMEYTPEEIEEHQKSHRQKEIEKANKQHYSK